MTPVDVILGGLPEVVELAEVPAPSPPNMAAGWWEQRAELTHIRQAAHARARSADAVFGVVLARVAALVPPTVTLPAVVGTVGTLDLLVGLIARSGGASRHRVVWPASWFPSTTMRWLRCRSVPGRD